MCMRSGGRRSPRASVSTSRRTHGKHGHKVVIRPARRPRSHRVALLMNDVPRQRAHRPRLARHRVADGLSNRLCRPRKSVRRCGGHEGRRSTLVATLRCTRGRSCRS
ncbi:hypothetical protein I4F81_008973 [Pyropia yezoensis]|uniref:Uncharacterized protein n=1 Tax=Pyropia yezoensis TaxID=2788 RepID=A0ACC3C8L7_PYRYE|nr:hypothetical protein I4F81_008973 [Neopyropia yezoensis]